MAAGSANRRGILLRVVEGSLVITNCYSIKLVNIDGEYSFVFYASNRDPLVVKSNYVSEIGEGYFAITSYRV